MDKIILNDGNYQKINKKTLLQNNHSKGLINIPELNEYYNYSIKNLPFTRFVDDLPQIPYKQLNIHNYRSTRHYGQRKLCLSEIEFFNIMYRKYNLKNVDVVNVLYIGAATGQHIPILLNIFPNIYFFLYDPNNFNININKNIEINQQLFNDNDVKRFINISKNSPLLFISDIRNNKYNIYSKNNEQLIKNDMLKQKNWTQKINPLGAMFKFRLPYYDDKNGIELIDYFVGKNYLPVWGPVSTTETRLICNRYDTNNWTLMCKYNNKIQEERMFYFNNCYRMNIFNHIHINNVKGLCNCYDCTSEINIIYDYLNLYEINDNNKISQIMNELSKLTNKNLNSPNRY